LQEEVRRRKTFDQSVLSKAQQSCYCLCFRNQLLLLLSAACHFCYVYGKWKKKDEGVNIPIKKEAMDGPRKENSAEISGQPQKK